MSIEQNNESQTSSVTIGGYILTGMIIGGLLCFLFDYINSKPPTLDNVDEIIQAIPGNKKDSASQYVLKAVQLNARLQSELDSYTRNTRISQSLQLEIAGAERNCKGDTIKGVNFEIIPLIKSLLIGQNHEFIEDLELTNYGIFVAFGIYPSVRPLEFPVDINVTEYNDFYKDRRTAFINYTKIVGSDTLYLNEPTNGTNPTSRIADNLGMVCPRYCPQ
jgi:hypothetical protein